MRALFSGTATLQDPFSRIHLAVATAVGLPLETSYGVSSTPEQLCFLFFRHASRLLPVDVCANPCLEDLAAATKELCSSSLPFSNAALGVYPDRPAPAKAEKDGKAENSDMAAAASDANSTNGPATDKAPAGTAAPDRATAADTKAAGATATDNAATATAAAAETQDNTSNGNGKLCT